MRCDRSTIAWFGCVGIAAILVAACSGTGNTPGAVDARQVAAQGGWKIDYVTTRCLQFNEDMTAAQRLAAADGILNGDWYADPPSATGGGEGYPNPPDWLVSQFDDAISVACTSKTSASLTNAANSVIASSGHWRLEGGS